jgi:hypothetical protein
LAAAEATKSAILTALSSRARHQSEAMIEQYLAMEALISTTCETGEALAMKKQTQIQHAQQQERMKVDLGNNRATMDFLAAQLWPISQADLDVALRCREWPARITTCMKDFATKAAADQKRFERDLRGRRKAFAEGLDSLQARVEAFQAYDKVALRSEYAKEVRVSLAYMFEF